jgi:hypothetical protein
VNISVEYSGMASRREVVRPVRHIRVGIAVALAALTGTYILADPADDGVNASGTVAYTEQAAGAALRPSGTVTAGTYDGGYIDFALTGGTSAEDIGFTTVGSQSTASGVVSIVGTSVYLGNGTTADNIGSVDATRNGQNGQPLRINFVNSFPNPSFEDGLTGWTPTTTRIDLGVTSLGGYQTVDNSQYIDYGRGCSRYNDNATPQAIGTYTVSPISSDKSDGSWSLELKSQGITTANGGDIVHGPAVASPPFQASPGDRIYFDWRAYAGVDNFHIHAFIQKTDGSGTTTVLNATGSSDTAQTNWATKDVTIPSAGSANVSNWRFFFVSGTQDYTCYQGAGARLLIDNVRVFGSKVDATVAANVAKLVTYANDSDNPAATRSVSFRAVNGSGTTTTTETITVNITGVDDPPTLTNPSTITYTNTSADDTFANATGTLSSGFSDPDGDTPTYDLPGGASETVTINSVTYDRYTTGTFGTLRLNSSTGQYVMVPNEAALDPEQVSQSGTFAVRATATGVDADATLTLAVSVPASAPTAPTAVTANPSGTGGVALSWTAPSWLGGSAVTSYTVQKSANGSTSWTTATTSATTSATVTGLTAPSTWYFRVTATNSTGTSSVSSTASSNTYGLPSAPTNLAATPGDQSASITWTVLANDGGAAITAYEYRVDSGSWTPAGLDGSETITDLTNGTPHSIELRAVNAAGAGSAASVTVTPRTIPGAPASLASSGVAADGFDLTFSAAADGGDAISRYEYRVDQGGGFGSWTTTARGTPATISLSSLPDDTSIDVEIRAVNAAGDGPAAAITVQTPARTLTVSAASTSILVDGTTTLSHTVDAGAGDVTYTTTGPCSVSGTTVTATGAGTCTVTGTIAADSASVNDVTYSSVTDTETITISLETQSALSVTGPPTTLEYGDSATLATSGGSGSGAVTFSHGSSTACVVDSSSGVVTMTAGVGTCDVTATKSATYRYSAITSPAVSITAAPRSVTVTGPTPASIVYGDAVPTLTPVYSGLADGDTEVADVTCSTDYDPTDTTNRVVGTYATTCTISGSDPNYTPTFETGQLVVGRKVLRITAPSEAIAFGATAPATFTPTITGFVNGDTVTDITAPTCTTAYTLAAGVGEHPITCSGASATNYSFLYTDGVLTVGTIAQAGLITTVRTADDTVFDLADDTAVFGQRLTLNTAGGSGTGAISHSAGSSDACTVTTTNGVTTIEITAGTGTCKISTTKSADTNHLVASTTTTIDVGPATLRRPGAPTVVAVNPTTIRVGIPQVADATSHTVRLLASTTVVASVTVAAGTAEVTFRDLDPSTAYTATVTAISASDNWVDSTASEGTATTTPAPQTPPRATSTTSTAAFGTSGSPAPTLVTASDAPAIARQPGTGGGNGTDGRPLDVVVRTLVADPAVAAAVATPPAERTPEQVAAIQTAARELAADFDAERPAGVAPLFSVIETPTGVVIRGLLDTTDTGPIDPDATTQIIGDVPFENAVILESSDSMMVIAAVDATGTSIELSPDGVLEIYGATVAAAAFGFEPNASGEVIIFSDPRLVASFATDDYGAFLGEFEIPTDVEPGEHTLVFTTPDFTKTLGIRIAEPTRMLPNTGADTDGILPWLILLTAVGGFVWISSTGRSRRATA